MEDQLNGKAILYVLRLIWNAIDYGGKNEFLYDSLLFNDMAEFGVPERNLVIQAFGWLEAIKIIETQHVKGGVYDREPVLYDTAVGFLKFPDPVLHIKLVNQSEFIKLFRKYNGKEVKAYTSRLVLVSYEEKAGVGFVNGKMFKLSKGNKRLFDMLYKNIGNWCERKQIADLLGIDTKDSNSSATTIEINNHIKNLRTATSLNKEQLQLKAGNIRLNASNRM